MHYPRQHLLNPSRTPQPTIQLSKINLMKFEGKTSLWTPFWEQFNQLIHKSSVLADIDWFVYLRSVLTGTAASAIAGFPATASCCCEALDLLKRSFAKINVIIQTHMQRPIDMRTVQSSNDLRVLQCLYD
ncbi:hypothetical protein HPB51_004644 [Rhipicephalus microplus]|uniref:Tick transposon n=1 Tax=Rhipicephalus microplus TaxID=6941 RepID=A0A9J6DL02_RHIMP|nr:hypothetical protein HPB51_004644 [Rhipicephalus microplus]